MDLSDANTEPYYRFHRFNEELNRTMRITVAGLVLVRQLQRGAAGPIELPKDGEPFGKNLWNNHAQGVPPAKGFLSQMGVVRVVTSLEDLCVGIQAECIRFAAIKGRSLDQNPVDEDDAEGFSPKTLYTSLGWNKHTLESVGPLYEYFSLVRNCIVHRSGRASKDLNKYSAGSRLSACVDGWIGPRRKKLPALPTIVVGNDISLLPRHAILASEVCQRIAKDANEKLLRYLGEEGVVYMAAYYSLLRDKPIATDAKKTAQAVLNYFLTSRYRVKLNDRHEAVQVLARMEKWKQYLRKLERLNPKAQPVSAPAVRRTRRLIGARRA